MDLKALAIKVLEAKQPAKLELKKPENSPKLFTPKNTQKFSPQKAVPYLDDQGRFCVKGLLPDGTILDELIKLGASDMEIEKHIFPLNHPRAWQRWQEIKQRRNVTNYHWQHQKIKI